MRWLVEVSALGKTDLQEHHVEAETWQKALQEARSRRGEGGPMSGFSIELLEEGYRAVDPVARVRFVVKRAPEVPEAPAASKASKVGSAVPGLPMVTVVSTRVQEPSDAMPLAYREYAFALPTGTSEEIAAEVLIAQLAFVRADLEEVTASKLVQLAAFDVAYTGKPPVLPLATLTWKDWKGEPVVGHPRRGGPNMPSRPPAVAPPSMPAPAPAPALAPAPTIAADPFASAKPAPPQPPAGAQARMGSWPPPDGTPGVRSPSGRFTRGRMSADELITSLFEAMHDLHFLRDALDGGQFCLALATEMLPSRAALIHFFDVEKREWVVASTRGQDMAALLATRFPESDEVLRAAARNRRAVVHADASTMTAARYAAAGGPRSVIVAPIMQAGRALGALEIINPLDGRPFDTDEGNAVTYIAEQYAEYLGSRGIVVDDRRIRAAANR